MSVIFHILVWLLGMIIAIQVVAACYSLVDFPGQQARYRWTIFGRIVLRLVGLIAIYWLLPASMEGTFVDGVQFLVLVHLLMIFVPNLILLRGRLNQDRNYQQYLADLEASRRH